MLAAEGHSRCRIEIRSSGGWDALPFEKYARKFADAADASVSPHHLQRLGNASTKFPLIHLLAISRQRRTPRGGEFCWHGRGAHDSAKVGQY